MLKLYSFGTCFKKRSHLKAMSAIRAEQFEVMALTRQTRVKELLPVEAGRVLRRVTPRHVT